MSKIVDLAEVRKKRDQKRHDEAYKQALAQILERAKKTDW
jgi:hypothetical protein